MGIKNENEGLVGINDPLHKWKLIKDIFKLSNGHGRRI